jgi:sulfopyruvate decarboxylase alpha subunit|tara:strand:+ start:660 stop:1217 length:558 start_codon:yes stop_codon:yes gene_type:complete
MTKINSAATPIKSNWPEEVHDVFKKLDIDQVCHVPDAGHAKLIKLCQSDKNIICTTLTSEEEGVAMLLGSWLGGKRGALLMQSSGVGNVINMLGLSRTCRYPVLMLITMRGEWGEFNPWQNPMGQACRPVLEAIGAKVFDINTSSEVADTVTAASALAFNAQQAVAVIFSQKFLGAKTFTEETSK